MRKALLYASIFILAAGCSFYWDASVTMTLRSGEKMECPFGIDSDSNVVYCFKEKKRVLSQAIKIPWSQIVEFNAHGVIGQ